MIAFAESYPVLAALLVALISWLATASELFLIQEKVLAFCTTVMGALGIVAAFGAAQRSGSLSLIGVVLVFVVYMGAVAYLWTRKNSND
jgi:hypothetical protein